MKSEIGEIVRFYRLKLKVSWQNMINKGVMGKNLFNILHAAPVVCPMNNPGIYGENQIELLPPKRYEDEYFNAFNEEIVKSI